MDEQDNVNLDYFFNNVPLYVKKKFQIYIDSGDGNYSLNEAELDRFIEYLGLTQDRTISYCHKCRHVFPFITRVVSCDDDYSIPIVKPKNVKSGFSVSMNLMISTGEVTAKFSSVEEKSLIDGIFYLKYRFECANNDEHKYMMFVSITADKGLYTVTKIGQNPSMITIKGYDFDIYKKQLKEFNAYEDYKKADLCNADNFHVGAYSYLRRIFEKMLNKFSEGMAFKDNRVETKIEAVKFKFDPRIQDMLKRLYGILSVSIHELDEDVSKEYYEYLKAIIDIQLEFLKTENDKDIQTIKLNSTLNKIMTNLSLDKD